MLQFMESQRIRHDLTTEKQQLEQVVLENMIIFKARIIQS